MQMLMGHFMLADQVEKSAEDKIMMSSLRDYVRKNIGESLNLCDLAKAVGLKPFTFARRFRQHVGMTPMHWVWRYRVVMAAQFMGRHPERSLIEVAVAFGFSSPAHFSRTFRRHVGLSPRQFLEDLAPGPDLGLSF